MAAPSSILSAQRRYSHSPYAPVVVGDDENTNSTTSSYSGKYITNGTYYRPQPQHAAAPPQPLTSSVHRRSVSLDGTATSWADSASASVASDTWASPKGNPNHSRTRSDHFLEVSPTQQYNSGAHYWVHPSRRRTLSSSMTSEDQQLLLTAGSPQQAVMAPPLAPGCLPFMSAHNACPQQPQQRGSATTPELMCFQPVDESSPARRDHQQHAQHRRVPSHGGSSVTSTNHSRSPSAIFSNTAVNGTGVFTAPPSATIAYPGLTGRCQYIELPSEEQLMYLPLPGVGTEEKTEHSAFFGQIRFEVTPRQMIWLVLYLTQGTCHPVFLHARNPGCFQAYFRTAEEAARLRDFNQLLLCDRTGMWHARDHDELAALTHFISTKDNVHGLPRGAMIVRR